MVQSATLPVGAEDNVVSMRITKQTAQYLLHCVQTFPAPTPYKGTRELTSECFSVRLEGRVIVVNRVEFVSCMPHAFGTHYNFPRFHTSRGILTS